FESGNFSENDWYFGGDSDWVIDNSIFYSGLYSSKSGIITDNQSTSMSIDFEFVEDGTVSFYKKVSSEPGYDKLFFYIDDISQGAWSGESGWSYHSYPVSTGNHTLSWIYIKDVNTITGLDCAWVDNILVTGILLDIEEDQAVIPDKPMLYQNYPNPFNPATTIRFSVPSVQNVKLNIFNSNGQLVKNIIDKKMDKGIYSITFDAKDLISGIYFYTLETDNKKLTQKMLLIK
ncbi:MAG: T9SS type A sorting domain-containing protein, partial [Candidatus Delongbacteria bacterium]|nr:T9SS type A sorting domain-containing protein [Candidatus Delongbacteria bacterium]MCG2761342.1 T9SS type A sorting domain-containing protein [Candidatus Delongbacteria bacterium]